MVFWQPGFGSRLEVKDSRLPGLERVRGPEATAMGSTPERYVIVFFSFSM